MLLDELIEDKFFETKTAEFKSELNPVKPISWLKTVDAFANCEGGTIYVGVNNETCELIGLKREGVDFQVQTFIKTVKEHFQSIPTYSFKYTKFRNENDEERFLLEIKIEESKAKPIVLTYDGIPSIYVRDEGRTSSATSEQIRQMVLSTSSIDFDCIETDIPYNKDHFKLLFATFKEKHKGEELTEKILRSENFYSDKSFLYKGSLLFKDDFVGQETKTVCIKWNGINKGDSTYLNEQEFSGNILQNIESVIDYIERNSDSGFLKEDRGRKTIYSYPKRSLFEGMINAYAHKDYFIANSEIHVNLFKDRLEITSPGSLVNGETFYRNENLIEIDPVRRNDKICAILKILLLMEKNGTGFSKIEDDYSSFGKKYAPLITSNKMSFTLTLPNLLSPTGIINEDTTDLPLFYENKGEEKKNDKTILSYCYYSPKTLEEIANILSVKVSSYLRNDIKNRLVNNGLLLEGKNRNAITYKTNTELVKLI